MGDGVSIVNFAIPIVGNEEFIHELSKIIEDDTIDSAASLDLFLKEILVGERSYHRDIVNVIKKRRWNKGFLVPRSRRQNNNTRGISALGERSGGSAATRGESGNSNESGNKELDYRHSIHSVDSYATGAHITEETIRTNMKRGHQVAKANIRKRTLNKKELLNHLEQFFVFVRSCSQYLRVV